MFSLPMAAIVGTRPEESAMSDKCAGWVWDQPDLLPQRRLILLWLANRATDNPMADGAVGRPRSVSYLADGQAGHWPADYPDVAATVRARAIRPGTKRGAAPEGNGAPDVASVQGPPALCPEGATVDDPALPI
jgi:hypothetical protein